MQLKRLTICLACIFASVSMIGCTESTVVNFGTLRDKSGKQQIISTENIAGNVVRTKNKKVKQSYYFIAGPPPGTNSKFSVGSHSSVTGIKAETTEVAASAVHTRFVLELADDGTVRVYHYMHEPGQFVMVRSKLDKFEDIKMETNMMVEIKAPGGGGPLSVVTTTNFDVNFDGLPPDRSAFLKAVEQARTDANLPGVSVP